MFQPNCPGSTTLDAVRKANYDAEVSKYKRIALKKSDSTLEKCIDNYDKNTSIETKIINFFFGGTPPQLAAYKSVLKSRKKLHQAQKELNNPDYIKY